MKKQRGNLFPKLLILFTVLPIIELYLLFKIADIMDWGFTIILVILTGIVGVYLAKQEGRQILYRIQAELNNRRLPGEELINGLCVLIGGALLLTPGILTDIIGFSLIIPIIRNIYKKWLKNKFKLMIERGSMNIYYDI